MKIKIISSLLAIATLLSSILPVSAAKQEKFISDVALIYEDSVKEAEEAIKDTEWELYEVDLNANADYMFDNGVYLIYKTTTDVEEAITDLRVMDMYGGFSLSDYERQLEKSRKKYLEMISAIRTAAQEFQALYNAGDEMATLAYRQMNYYKDVGETDKLMGDFLLNIPSDNDLVRVMMEGNSLVTSNLVSLLAIGISGASDKTLATRIAELYAERDTLSAEAYYDDAVILSEYFDDIRSKLQRYDALSDEYDIHDDNMTEEEFVFLTQYMPLAIMLDEIMLGDKSIADVVREGEWQISDLYPIVAALSKGQMALTSLGQFELILKYATPSKPIEELKASLDESEKEMKDENGVLQPVDVYEGVDRSIFDGAFAMTTAAERQQALTGETWGVSDAAKYSLLLYCASFSLLGFDIIFWSSFISEYKTVSTINAYLASGATVPKPLKTWALDWTASSSGYFWAAIGVSLVLVGLSSFATWYNYYNPTYTEIPNVMIDVRETDLGDKYVKYTAAKVFGEGDQNADFNAYEGKEWNALYYTKDANAGKCLTPNFKFSTTDPSVARRHQGVSMFGETEAFDLNSHVYNDDAEGAYLSVRYSNTKKAAADIPEVVGSIFTSGKFYFLTAACGIGLGMGVMALATRKKGKPENEAPVSSV